MEAGNWRIAAAVEYTAQRNALLRQLDQAASRLARVREKVAVLEAEIASLDAAAKAFGLQVSPESPTLFDKPMGHHGQAPTEAGGQFKDVALDLLREAYPSSLKASQIQARVQAKLNRTFHWKTAGMTLYRLKQDGHVKREGQNWFYVPSGVVEQVLTVANNVLLSVTPPQAKEDESDW